MECIFCKISNGQLPANIIYSDDEMLAFYDLHPKADIHFLLIPRLHIESMLHLKEIHASLIAQLMLKANTLAQELGLSGYKIHINTGANGGQEVFHLHIHVFGNK